MASKNSFPLLETDGVRSEGLGPVYENLAWAALAGNRPTRMVIGLFQMAVLRYDLAFEENTPCPNVSLSVSEDSRYITMTIDTTHPFGRKARS